MYDGEYIVRIYRSRPDDELVVSISRDSGKTFEPVAIVNTLHVESEIIDGTACETSGLGSYIVCAPRIRAEYVKSTAYCGHPKAASECNMCRLEREARK